MKSFRNLPGEEVARIVHERVKEFERWQGGQKFREEARDSYEFKDGRQWPSEDIEYLREQNRPPVVINRVLKFVDAVVGTEINNKMEVQYVVAGIEDTPAVDLVTKVVKQTSEEDGEAETSAAFEDAVTVGMGWTKLYMEYGENPEGRIAEQRIDPLRMGWDYRARRRNLSDARWVFEVRGYTLDEIEMDFPGKSEFLSTGGDPHLSPDKHPAELLDRGEYEFDDDDPDDEVGAKRYKVVCFQQMVDREHVLAINPMNGQQETLSIEQFTRAAERITAAGAPMPAYAKQKQRVCEQVYVCGDTLLTDIVELPCRTYEPITGKWDRNRGIFYGVVRVARDPQEWSNKFFSNIMHIMSSAGKGVMVEEGALPANEERDFEKNWSNPSRVKKFAEGALAAGRVQPVPPSPLPPGLPDMMSFATNSIPDTLGLSPEFIGMAGRTQSGVVERSRRQAGLAVLSKFFQSRREHIKRTGRIKLAFALRYMPDSVFMEIGGPEAQAILPTLRQARFAEYDIRVDEAPSEPDQKAAVWGDIMQMMPALQALGLPAAVWLALLEYSPWPASLVRKVQQALSQPNPTAEKAQQLDLQQKQADVAETFSKVMLNQAKAKAEGEPDMSNVISAQVEAKKAQLESDLSVREHQMKLVEMDQKTRHAGAKHVMDMQKLAMQAAQPKVTNGPAKNS